MEKKKKKKKKKKKMKMKFIDLFIYYRSDLTSA